MQSSTIPKGYYETEHWKRKRDEARLHYSWKCAVCDLDYRLKGGWIAVHHLHYRTLWRETMRDLRLLCRDHHPKGLLSDYQIGLWRSSYRWMRRVRAAAVWLGAALVWSVTRKRTRRP